MITVWHGSTHTIIAGHIIKVTALTGHAGRELCRVEASTVTGIRGDETEPPHSTRQMGFGKRVAVS